MADPRTAPAVERSALFRRSFRRSYPEAVRGKGVHVWDSAGKQYLDFCGSAVVNFIGHGDAEVVRAMGEQASSLEFVHSSQFVTPIAEEFAAEMLDFAGTAFEGGAVYFTSGGSEAVETALKLARQYQVESGHTERYRIISRDQSYHGSTLGAMAVSGNRARRDMYLPMLREFEHIASPYCYRCKYACDGCGEKYAAELEAALSRAGDSAAAFIFEPLSGATLGAVVPPDSYLRRVAEICKGRGVLLIADEVMTGCGRTGCHFAVEHWDITPDILVAGKGIASGYAPLGAVIANRKVVDAIASGSGAFVHGFTYNAHPVAVAAGRAVIRRVRQRKLVAAADSRDSKSAAGTLRAALQTLTACNSVGDVRGLGLLWAVEFVRDRAAKAPFDPSLRFSSRVFEAARERGVLVYPMQGSIDGKSGDHIVVAPPAVIRADEITSGIAQLADAIRAAEQSLRS